VAFLTSRRIPRGRKGCKADATIHKNWPPIARADQQRGLIVPLVLPRPRAPEKFPVGEENLAPPRSPFSTLNCFKRRGMKQAVRGQHSNVAKQAASASKIDRVAAKIRDSSARLFDQQRPSRLIPDRIVEAVWRKAQQEITHARSDGHVLRLTVHQQRGSIVSQQPQYARTSPRISVAPFE
jgi:hypothetical protein